MENLLYHKLSELSKEEYKEFIQFAASPFFNTNKRIPELLRLLQPAHPQFEEGPLTAKNKLIKALGLKSEEALRQLRTPTLQLLPRFFAVKEMELRPNTFRLLLLDGLLRRKMDGEIKSVIEDFENAIDPEDRPFHTQFRLDDFRLQELLRRQESIGLYDRYIESGNRYFLLKKIKQACQLLLFQQIYGQKSASSVFAELEFLLPLHEKLLEEQPVLRSWQRLFELMNHPDRRVDLEPLLHTLSTHKQRIPLKEQKDLLNSVSNLLIGRLTQGHYNTLEELNWFYDTLFRQFLYLANENLLVEGGFIHHIRFKNVVGVAIIARQFDWVRRFLQENIDKVLPEYREDLHCFCLSYIAFGENNLQLAAEYLARISTRNSDFYYFDLESVQMRIFILENEYELFEARSEAVRKKLKHSNLSQAHLDNYGNYFKLLRELYHLVINPNTTPELWDAFRRKVEHTNPVNQKKWLLEFTLKRLK